MRLSQKSMIFLILALLTFSLSSLVSGNTFETVKWCSSGSSNVCINEYNTAGTWINQKCTTTQCPYGCSGGDCKTTCTALSPYCMDSSTLREVKTDCSDKRTTCPYGCENNACKAAPVTSCTPKPWDSAADSQFWCIGTGFWHTDECGTKTWVDGTKACCYLSTYCSGNSVMSQDTNCNVNKIKDCGTGYECGINAYGTADCKLKTCTATKSCTDTSTLKEVKTDCSETTTTCQYGCEGTACKSAPTATCTATKTCISSTTLRETKTDCSTADTVCQYGCDSNTKTCKSAPTTTTTTTACVADMFQKYCKQNIDQKWELWQRNLEGRNLCDETKLQDCVYGCEGTACKTITTPPATTCTASKSCSNTNTLKEIKTDCSETTTTCTAGYVCTNGACTIVQATDEPKSTQGTITVTCAQGALKTEGTCTPSAVLYPCYNGKTQYRCTNNQWVFSQCVPSSYACTYGQRCDKSGNVCVSATTTTTQEPPKETTTTPTAQTPSIPTATSATGCAAGTFKYEGECGIPKCYNAQMVQTGKMQYRCVDNEWVQNTCITSTYACNTGETCKDGACTTTTTTTQTPSPTATTTQPTTQETTKETTPTTTAQQDIGVLEERKEPISEPKKLDTSSSTCTPVSGTNKISCITTGQTYNKQELNKCMNECTTAKLKITTTPPLTIPTNWPTTRGSHTGDDFTISLHYQDNLCSCSYEITNSKETRTFTNKECKTTTLPGTICQAQGTQDTCTITTKANNKILGMCVGQRLTDAVATIDITHPERTTTQTPSPTATTTTTQEPTKTTTTPAAQTIQAGSTTCTDSDGGKNYYEKGSLVLSVASETKTFTDRCDKGLLHEYYCETDNTAAYIITPVGDEDFTCPTGYSCQDGACAAQQLTQAIASIRSVGVKNLGFVEVVNYFRSGRK